MKIDHNVPLTDFNSFAVCAYADELVVLNSVQQLPELLPVLAERQNRLIIGGGSNILLCKDFNGLVILNRLMGIQLIKENQDHVLLEVGAGENWHDFVCWCIDHNNYGLENLSLIPGTVGASPIQNIGAYGIEVEDYIDSLTAYDLANSKRITFDRSACKFTYRDSIFKQNPDRYLITAVRFKLSKHFLPVLTYSGVREHLLASGIQPEQATAKQLSEVICNLRSSKLPDPAVIGNAGSFFKNPVISMAQGLTLRDQFPDLPMYRTSDNHSKLSAAWLIDQCGYKGFRVGDAGVYQDHALVLVNYGKASGEEIWQLSQTIKQAVMKSYGISLVPEPRIL